MSRLTPAQTVLIRRAALLVERHAGVLSDFELQLVAEVVDRLWNDGAQTVVTHHEWPVIEDAVEAMTRARKASQTPSGAAPAARGVPSSRRTERERMLDKNAFSNINKVLSALVNGGGVRPEDQEVVQGALDELKQAEAADATAISTLQGEVADHESRISALETGVDGEAKAATPISFTPTTLPAATAGEAFSATLVGAGGAGGPYEFKVFSGSLPDGLNLTDDGVISGVPTTVGSFDFDVDVSDTDLDVSEPVSLTIVVAAAADTAAETQPGQGSGGDTTTAQTASQAAQVLA